MLTQRMLMATSAVLSRTATSFFARSAMSPTTRPQSSMPTSPKLPVSRYPRPKTSAIAETTSSWPCPYKMFTVLESPCRGPLRKAAGSVFGEVASDMRRYVSRAAPRGL